MWKVEQSEMFHSVYEQQATVAGGLYRLIISVALYSRQWAVL